MCDRAAETGGIDDDIRYVIRWVETAPPLRKTPRNFRAKKNTKFLPTCYCGIGAEGAEKFLRYLTSTFEDFLHFCEVSEDKID